MLGQVIADMKVAGSEEIRRTHARHGVKPPAFGISASYLKAEARRIRRDQPLAEALWNSGNHDARILAMMVAEPELCAPQTLERWCRTVDNALLSDAFAGFAARYAEVHVRVERWCADRAEFVRSNGYRTVAQLAASEAPPPADWFRKRVSVIEKEIHGSASRAREAMHHALVAIGTHCEALANAVRATARRIGEVEVDFADGSVRRYVAESELERSGSRRKRSSR